MKKADYATNFVSALYEDDLTKEKARNRRKKTFKKEILPKREMRRHELLWDLYRNGLISDSVFSSLDDSFDGPLAYKRGVAQIMKSDSRFPGKLLQTYTNRLIRREAVDEDYDGVVAGKGTFYRRFKLRGYLD